MYIYFSVVVVVPCLHMEITGQLVWIGSSLWVLDIKLSLSGWMARCLYLLSHPAGLTLFGDYHMLIIHNNGFIFMHRHNIFQSCSPPTISCPSPLLLIPLLIYPARFCHGGVCVTYRVSLGWETKVYDVNFITYSNPLNFEYIQ